MRLTCRVHAAAPVPAVWAVLREPAHWPAIEPTIRRVLPRVPRVAAGQRLVVEAVATGLRIPVDVDEVVPERLLALTIRVAPGLTTRRSYELVRTLRGGTSISAVSSSWGPFGVVGAGPSWVAALVSLRLLARRAERAYRTAARVGAA